MGRGASAFFIAWSVKVTRQAHRQARQTLCRGHSRFSTDVASNGMSTSEELQFFKRCSALLNCVVVLKKSRIVSMPRCPAKTKMVRVLTGLQRRPHHVPYAVSRRQAQVPKRTVPYSHFNRA